MFRFTVSVLIGILLLSFLSLPCRGNGRWGAEVSTNLNTLALIKSFSLKNELFLRMQYDWTEYLKDKDKSIIQYHYPDTLYGDEENTYSSDSDHSYRNLSLEMGYSRFFGSGKGFSPNVGLSFEISSQSWEESKISHDDYGSSKFEENVKWNDLSFNFDFGFRYLFNQHFSSTLQ